MLLFFVLIYVGIVGGLLARLMQREMGSLFKGKGEKPESIPVRG